MKGHNSNGLSRCPQCGGPTIPEMTERVPYRPTGRALCINLFCPSTAFSTHLDSDISFGEDEHVEQRGWGQED